MQLYEVFLGLGQDSFAQLVRGISIGKLKTYQLYDRLKTRLHLPKLNSEGLRKGAPRFWERLVEQDETFATELAQGILVSHMDMITAALDVLGIPNEDGFFAKALDATKYLTEGWQQRALDALKDRFPEPLVVFYVNHLGWELLNSGDVFRPAPAPPASATPASASPASASPVPATPAPASPPPPNMAP